ncbi:hypothetical protein [Nannocystis pusilla]|uniref:hypothetical protein n=1 Tax=Nannocystis pusilla TaxID=889268 RepID=UPI003B812827
MRFKAPLPPQRLGFLPTEAFWELAICTPLFSLSLVGYLWLLAALAWLLGVGSFTWWQHVLLAFTLSEVWSGIFELGCRRVLRRLSRPRLPA